MMRLVCACFLLASSKFVTSFDTRVEQSVEDVEDPASHFHDVQLAKLKQMMDKTAQAIAATKKEGKRLQKSLREKQEAAAKQILAAKRNAARAKIQGAKAKAQLKRAKAILKRAKAASARAEQFRKAAARTHNKHEKSKLLREANVLSNKSKAESRISRTLAKQADGRAKAAKKAAKKATHTHKAKNNSSKKEAEKEAKKEAKKVVKEVVKKEAKKIMKRYRKNAAKNAEISRIRYIMRDRAKDFKFSLKKVFDDAVTELAGVVWE
eukprot:TRINITY_DN45423_c0_g1_i1.p1 TRINITY_DN45423_c0_g1~~TRINITY_DN45423_c0_g1_i1.p1  ORF type:complete len:266 (-),score=59.15 TRINITY_DN45423_c0_g1_i1:41-838(-)